MLSGANLIQISDCVCPGYTLVYECTVATGGRGQLTVWKGTAFDCPSDANSIILSHSDDSDSVTIKQCNNGLIMANLVNENNGYYISQLNITVSSGLIGLTVECFHDDGRDEILIGNTTILFTNRPG